MMLDHSEYHQRNSIRILHVIHCLESGGIQTWLRSLLRVASVADIGWQCDIAVNRSSPCDLDEDFRALGCRIFDCSPASRPMGYLRRLRELQVQHGPYHVMHSHFDPAGLPLIAAKKCGIPIRIAHSHNAARQLTNYPGWIQLASTPVLRGMIRFAATHRIAASRLAAESMFGRTRVQRGQTQTIYYGIEIDRFSRDEALPRRKPQPERPRLLHIGRFAEQKNHRFLLRIFAAFVKICPGATLSLVGDGALRPEIERLAEQQGLSSHVKFLGVRKDIPQLMSEADLMIMPSFYEGLPVTLIEAQASGLRCVISDTISSETIAVPELICWKSLADSPEAWARAISTHALRSTDQVNSMRGGPFDIEQSVQLWNRVYRGNVG